MENEEAENKEDRKRAGQKEEEERREKEKKGRKEDMERKDRTQKEKTNDKEMTLKGNEPGLTLEDRMEVEPSQLYKEGDVFGELFILLRITKPLE